MGDLHVRRPTVLPTPRSTQRNIAHPSEFKIISYRLSWRVGRKLYCHNRKCMCRTFAPFPRPSYVSKAAHTRSIFDADDGFSGASVASRGVRSALNKQDTSTFRRLLPASPPPPPPLQVSLKSRRNRSSVDREMRCPISSDPAAPCFRNIKFPSRSLRRRRRPVVL